MWNWTCCRYVLHDLDSNCWGIFFLTEEYLKGILVPKIAGSNNRWNLCGFFKQLVHKSNSRSTKRLEAHTDNKIVGIMAKNDMSFSLNTLKKTDHILSVMEHICSTLCEHSVGYRMQYFVFNLGTVWSGSL